MALRTAPRPIICVWPMSHWHLKLAATQTPSWKLIWTLPRASSIEKFQVNDWFFEIFKWRLKIEIWSFFLVNAFFLDWIFTWKIFVFLLKKSIEIWISIWYTSGLVMFWAFWDEQPQHLRLEGPSFWQHFLGWIAQILFGWIDPTCGNTFWAG